MLQFCRHLCVAACLGGLVGCGGENEVPVFPAKGTITVEGKPAARADIMLFPVNPSEEMKLLRPNASADEQGNFTLSTYGFNDGAPEGEYQVSIVWHGPLEGYDPADLPEEELTSGPDQLNGKYGDPKTSGLKATITPGTNQLPPFQLEQD